DFEALWPRVEALISGADAVVFVLSPDSIASQVALREVSFAASLNKRIAPVVWRRVDDKLVPEALANLNFIFFDHEHEFEQRADQLAQALRTDKKLDELARLRANATAAPAGLELLSAVARRNERPEDRDNVPQRRWSQESTQERAAVQMP